LLCIRELENLDLSPVDRIQIYQRFKLNGTRLLDCYESLTTRDEPLGIEEGAKLGLESSLQIARAREVSRGPEADGGRSPSPVQLRGPDLRSLISAIFQFPPIFTNEAAYAGPSTTPFNDSYRVDRESALPTVNNCSLLLRVLMIIFITFCRWPPHRKRIQGVVPQRVTAVHPNSSFR
jgi:hypothetical protein